MAFLIPNNLAIFKTCLAPFLKFLVTSFPDLVITFFPFYSAGSLGVGKPPNCSGQTGIKISFFANSKIFLFRLLLPSYRHFIPNRQALQIFIFLFRAGDALVK